MPDTALMPTGSPTTESPAAPPNRGTATSADPAATELNKRIAKTIATRIDKCKTYKRRLIPRWKRAIELRIGKLADHYTGGIGDTDDIRAEIIPDWALTKTKTAQLFSIQPQIQLMHENEQYAQAVPPFRKALNYRLGEKGAHAGTVWRRLSKPH